MTSLLGLLVCGVILWSGGNPEYTPVLIVLAIAVVPLTLIKAYSSGIFLGKGMVGVFARLDRMVEVQKLLAVVVLVWLLSWGIAGALLASVLSGVVVAMYAVARVRRISPLWPRFDWPVIKALLSKGIVFAIALFVIQLNYRLDIALMDKLTTVKEIGIYTIGVGIAQLTWAFPQAITTVLFSRSANARDEIAFSQKVARLFRVTLIIALLLVVGLGLMASVFVPAFYGREFMASARVLQILLPGMFCMIALKILNMDLAGRGRPGASLWVMTPSLIANVLLNLYLIPRYGAYGAALSSSVSYSMGGIGMMLIYCRLTSLTLSQLWRYQRSDFAFLRRVRLQPVSVCADS
jgi:O-antigen/teichoic acid export membrane protein